MDKVDIQATTLQEHKEMIGTLIDDLNKNEI
jgi:hypothetical protein